MQSHVFKELQPAGNDYRKRSGHVGKSPTLCVVSQRGMMQLHKKYNSTKDCNFY